MANVLQKIWDWIRGLFGWRPSAPPPPQAPAAPPPIWQAQFSPGVTLIPAGDVFGFTFPQADGVHYIVRRHSGPLTVQLSLVFTLVADDGAKIIKSDAATNDGTAPPSVKLYFHSANDPTFQNEFGRWFAMADAEELSPGTHTVTAALDPERWVSVYGKRGDTVPEQFAAAIANVAEVGMVFGGGYFAGHGLYAQGAVTFHCNDFEAS